MPNDADKPLSMRHLLFSNAILEGASVTQAYRRAGFKVKSDKVASAAGSRLLSDVRVASYIENERTKRMKRTEITTDNLLESLWREGHDRSPGSTHSARVQALTVAGKVIGSFQSDRTNDADADADLLRDIRVRWAVAHHVAKGKPLEELMRHAEKNPLEVEDWAIEEGLMQKVARA